MTAASPEPFLRVQDVSRTFGGVRAVDGVSLDVAAGLVFGIIGPNGAGKTTLLNLLSGMIRPTAGQILFRGQRLDRLPAHAVARAGVARTYQNLRLFKQLSARTNVVAGSHLVGRSTLAGALACLPSARAEERDLAARADGLLELVGLAGKGDVLASALPYGDQRRLEMARALAANPALLLLDEPAAGMNQAEVEGLAQLIRRLAARGQTVLLIEHHVSLVMDVCDRLAVLNFGRKIAEGAPAEVAADPAVIEAYLGRE